MSLAAPPAPSWVRLDLDTTPPVLATRADEQIDGGDEWVVAVQANEALGPCTVSFLDAGGARHSVGFERPTERSLRIVLPTVGLFGGTLRVVARDRACNATVAVVPVVVRRSKPFEATLAIERTVEASMSVEAGFSATVQVEHGHEVASTVDHAYEVQADLHLAFDVTLEITDGH